MLDRVGEAERRLYKHSQTLDGFVTPFRDGIVAHVDRVEKRLDDQASVAKALHLGLARKIKAIEGLPSQALPAPTPSEEEWLASFRKADEESEAVRRSYEWESVMPPRRVRVSRKGDFGANTFIGEGVLVGYELVSGQRRFGVVLGIREWPTSWGFQNYYILNC